MARNLREHSRLGPEDVEQITRLSFIVRQYEPNEDIIRQGDVPKAAALVLSGMVGRYHLLNRGQRQYLSFPLTGDLPHSQGLLVEKMDHAVCAIGQPLTAFSPRSELHRIFKLRPQLGFVIWRET